MNYQDYFSDSIKIHAIGFDHGYDEKIIRTLVYIHMKIKENDDLNYFLLSSDNLINDQNALEIMLGLQDVEYLKEKIQELDHPEEYLYILNIADQIKAWDKMLYENYGLENRFTSEFQARLKLYTDMEYCNDMMEIYHDTILPNLNKYDDQKINKAIEKASFEKEKLENELKMMMNF